MTRCARILVLAALALALLPTATASAGRLLVTGHDADLHCDGGPGGQCHFVKVAVDYVRGGAPNPSAPVLVLDRLSLQLDRSLESEFFGGPPGVPRVVMDPRSAQFRSEPLTTDRYSAILVASDTTCGGCDLNDFFDPSAPPGSDTPDSNAINARKADIEAFFNAGGGLYANSGAEHGDGDPATGPDVYYDFLPVPADGVAVTEPFCLTAAGKALGFFDTECPDATNHNGDGSVQDINGHATHNSFQLPEAGSVVQVAEVDSAGFAETLFAEGVISGGQIRVPDRTPPDTPITIGPPFFGRDHTPTFTFTSTESGSRFECSIDGGPFVPCTSPFTTPRLAGGSHTFAVRAIDAAGNADATPTVYTFDIAVAVGELPRPTLGKKINVGPVPGGGPVFIAIRGGGSASRASAHASQKGLRFVPLTEARQVPVGSFLNTKRGTVQLVSASTKRNKVQSGRFNGGLFQVLQSRKRRERGLTDLKLKGSSFRRCSTTRRGKAGAAALRRRTIRRVRGSARGNFRTSGRGASATVRGTIWTLADRCDGTLTTVKRGKVAVRDFRKKRTIIVRAGKSYLAKVPR